MSTKELILKEALKLFSENGYAGTSMSDIAKPLGITKAALYKHFKSKQQIFDEILSESEERFKDIFEELSLHPSSNKNEEMNKNDVDVFSTITPEGLCESVLSFVRFSMNDTYSKQVRRMLTLSQFQSKELAEMYTKRYVETMLSYDEKLFENLMDRGIIRKGNSKTLARMFYAPVIMYMGLWDREPDRAKECEKAIRKHVEEFAAMTKM